jgi:hypothetical protein
LSPNSKALSDISKRKPPAESIATSPVDVNPVNVPSDVIFPCVAVERVADNNPETVAPAFVVSNFLLLL